ncbi:MAG: Lon protease family protein [Deltaproteobacteria bacterium]|nr:MAG: Lon protease family protein [Deltaproteobacteria bacterium]
MEGTEEPAVTAGDPFAQLQVNVVLTNAHRKGCPVVFEPSPSVSRLLGTIEHTVDETAKAGAEFMSIRAGSLLRANGGFLLLKAEDLLAEPGAWKVLKRALSTGQLEIRAPEGPMMPVLSGLKPDPIPLDVKIILHGDDLVYRMLYLADDDFSKAFKVKAEFDTVMDFNRSSLEKYMAFVQRVVKEEDLLAPNRAAVAALVEESIRQAEDQRKLSTRFRLVADLLREASYWARRCGRRNITRKEVEQAIEHRRRRVNLVEEKYREDIERDVIMVSTSGAKVGQVNGLAVFDLGDYSFGKPSRITASVGVGRQGVVNIEREAGLSGAIHDKGVYIISGFLAERFGRDVPLSLEARLCFEQSYGEIDGDSASSAEIYALLSALSGVPLRQSVAVTGSVNQHGELQPIGGINHKIEGFFDLCRSRGLDGSHGVVIPRANLPHLMLRQEVVDSVRKGKFHIWAASSVDEGMEILTGFRAGTPGRSGLFPRGTINRLVQDRLRSMAEALRDYS